MGEVHYMISEAAKKVSVEPHVLRYWEDELILPIGRNDMGHRFYTEENIQLFDCIKELKEQGLSLKELKVLIPDILRTKERLKLQKSNIPSADSSKAETSKEKADEPKMKPAAEKTESKKKNAEPAAADKANAKGQASADGQAVPASKKENSVLHSLTAEEKARLLKGMLSDVVMDALKANNKVLEEAVSSSVNDKVVRNMDYLLQAKERQEEDRYRKLDHLIRQQQANRKESAKLTPVRKFRRLLGEA